VGDSFLYLAYFVLALCFGILIHSAYLNGRKFSTIRKLTDTTCVCTVIQFFLPFQCSTAHCGQYKTSIVVDFLANGFFYAIVQGCDNYTTFFRYAAVVGEKRITRTRKILTLLYVIFALFFCWWPYYTIIPFFADMNGPLELETYVSSQYYWNFPCYVCYNLVRCRRLPLSCSSLPFPRGSFLFTPALSPLWGPFLNDPNIVAFFF
jgi:hypothetical protein